MLRFPLNNEINTTKTDRGEKAAVKNASDNSDVVFVRYSGKVLSCLFIQYFMH